MRGGLQEAGTEAHSLIQNSKKWDPLSRPLLRALELD